MKKPSMLCKDCGGSVVIVRKYKKIVYRQCKECKKKYICDAENNILDEYIPRKNKRRD